MRKIQNIAIQLILQQCCKTSWSFWLSVTFYCTVTLYKSSMTFVENVLLIANREGHVLENS